tara:strand:- start:109 stop:1536 length:1428 start_codon:yes stop_codon:yes gene_type:complete
MKNKLSILIVFYTICNSSCKDDLKLYRQSPNIVFLLADDLGYAELGSYGQKIIKTPNLDTLAASGMIFKNFYAGNAACAPSRAVLLTGKKSSKSSIRGNAGFYGNDRWEGAALDPNDFTMGKMFKNVGYQTAFIGKWHLDKPDDVNTWAVGHGFDFAVQEQWSSRFEGRKFLPNRLWVNGDQEFIPYDYKKYDCKDHLRTNVAFEFLDNRKIDKPFFLFMSYRAPHSFEGPIRDTLDYKERDWPEIEKAHAAKITLLDKQVGRLVRKLKEIGVLDNTLILFTSDNGPHYAKGGHDLEFFNSNGNLKGGKRDLYEGGIRVPLIAYWENKIRPESFSYHVSSFQDIIPTFSEIIGYKVPKNLDGISFLPTLISKDQPKHDYLNWEFQLSGWFQNLPNGGFRQSVRFDHWKAVRYSLNSDIELYDLNEDEGETNNQAHSHPKIVKKAKDIFENSRSEQYGFPYGGVVQNYKSMERFVQ